MKHIKLTKKLDKLKKQLNKKYDWQVDWLNKMSLGVQSEFGFEARIYRSKKVADKMVAKFKSIGVNCEALPNFLETFGERFPVHISVNMCGFYICLVDDKLPYRPYKIYITKYDSSGISSRELRFNWNDANSEVQWDINKLCETEFSIEIVWCNGDFPANKLTSFMFQAIDVRDKDRAIQEALLDYWSSKHKGQESLGDYLHGMTTEFELDDADV